MTEKKHRNEQHEQNLHPGGGQGAPGNGIVEVEQHGPGGNAVLIYQRGLADGGKGKVVAKIIKRRLMAVHVKQRLLCSARRGLPRNRLPLCILIVRTEGPVYAIRLDESAALPGDERERLLRLRAVRFALLPTAARLRDGREFPGELGLHLKADLALKKRNNRYADKHNQPQRNG